MLSRKEQELLVQMLEIKEKNLPPITSKRQKVYKNKVNFYKAIWKLRDLDLVAGKEIIVNGRKVKQWYLKLDGLIIAKILRKSNVIQTRNNR